MKELKLGLAAVSTIIAALICYNLYTNSVEREFRREMYLECLRVVEGVLKADPERISLPFCWGK